MKDHPVFSSKWWLLFYINRRTFIRRKDEQFLRNSTSLLKISCSTGAVGNIDYTGRKEINLQKERERERKIQHQKAGAFSRVVHFVWLIYSRVSTEIASVNRAFKDQQNRGRTINKLILNENKRAKHVL